MMTTGQPTGCTSASRLGVYPTVHEPIQGIVVKFYFQISFCMLSVKILIIIRLIIKDGTDS